MRAEVRDRLNPTGLQSSGVGVRGTVGPRCDHVGPLGSRAMMRASVRVSGVTLRPGVPGGLGYGAAARPGCANAVSLSGASCRRCSLRARTRVPRSPLRRTVLGGRGVPVPYQRWRGRGVSVPHQSVAGRPSRPIMPKAVGELFEVDSESAVGTRVARPRVGFRVVQRPTLPQPQVPRPPGRASTPRRPNELAASNVSRDEVTRWRSTGGDGCCCRGSRTLLVLR